MPLYKFGAGDVFYNQIKTHPSSSFYIYDRAIYYNNKATEPGSFTSNATNVPVGHISLFELNVDRASSTTGRTIGASSSIGGRNVADTGLIYPFVIKGPSKVAFKNIVREKYIHDYKRGHVISGSYQMSSSINRQRYQESANFIVNTNTTTRATGSALKNSLDFARRHGEHYNFPTGSTKTVNVIQIPSVFYGSEIKKGSVDLKMFVTGTLMGRLRDSRYNGALVQENGNVTTNNGEVAGVVLYKEGFIILTASWGLNPSFKVADKDYSNTTVTATELSWQNFAMGANDKYSSVGDPAAFHANVNRASYSIDFAGTHKVPTVTMLAHANRGELNYSNNPLLSNYKLYQLSRAKANNKKCPFFILFGPKW